jgi:hypothetical protein
MLRAPTLALVVLLLPGCATTIEEEAFLRLSAADLLGLTKDVLFDTDFCVNLPKVGSIELINYRPSGRMDPERFTQVVESMRQFLDGVQVGFRARLEVQPDPARSPQWNRGLFVGAMLAKGDAK